MAKNNSLPPASQPWVRELEGRIKALEKVQERSRAAVAPAGVQHVNLENLEVGALRVGGTEPTIIQLNDTATSWDWVKDVSEEPQGKISFTLPTPEIDVEPPFILEWDTESSSPLDGTIVTTNLDTPDDGSEDIEYLANEEIFVARSFSYLVDDPLDEDYVPPPEEFKITFTNPGDYDHRFVDVSLQKGTLHLVVPGTGGVVITEDGEIEFEDGAGGSQPISELTFEDVQKLEKTVADLEEAQAKLSKASALLEALGTAVDEDAITQALADYLDIPVDEVTWSGNLYQTVLARLLVATGIITEDMIATGAITAPKLNVVYTDPDSGYGFSLQPEGLTILDEEGSPVIVLRADMANFFGIVRDDEYLASISPEGDFTGRSFSANEELFYRGDEFTELLDQLPRGVIAFSSGAGNGSAVPGTEAGRVGAVTFRTPPDNRMVEVRFRGYIASGSARQVDINLRQSTGNNVKVTNSSVRFWRLDTNGYTPVELSVLLRTGTGGWGWPEDDTITVGLFAQTTSGQVTFHQNGANEMVVTDMGPAVPVQSHTPWVPTTGGGGGGGNQEETGKRAYTLRRTASWVRSFLGNNNHYNYGAGRAYQGLQPRTSNGNLKSMIGWAPLTSTLNGATIKSIKVKLKNGHTWANGGATAYIGLHGKTSAPSTFAYSVGDVSTPFYTRGQTRTITIPKAYHSGFVSGAYTGIVLYTGVSANARYGYWNGSTAELIIEYEK